MLSSFVADDTGLSDRVAVDAPHAGALLATASRPIRPITPIEACPIGEHAGLAAGLAEHACT